MVVGLACHIVVISDELVRSADVWLKFLRRGLWSCIRWYRLRFIQKSAMTVFIKATGLLVNYLLGCNNITVFDRISVGFISLCVFWNHAWYRLLVYNFFRTRWFSAYYFSCLCGFKLMGACRRAYLVAIDTRHSKSLTHILLLLRWFTVSRWSLYLLDVDSQCLWERSLLLNSFVDRDPWRRCSSCFSIMSCWRISRRYEGAFAFLSLHHRSYWWRLLRHKSCEVMHWFCCLYCGGSLLQTSWIVSSR